MEEELDTVKDQLLDAEIKLEQMKQELEDSSSVEVTSSGGDDDHAALIEQNKKLRTALSTWCSSVERENSNYPITPTRRSNTGTDEVTIPRVMLMF